MKAIKRFFILAFLLVAGSMSAGAQTYTYDINSDHVDITTGGTHIINGTGAPTANRIYVGGGITANITLNNVNIEVTGQDACAFDMTGATVNLTLTGNNILKSGASRSGLRVPSGATLTIAGTGSLTANGGSAGAGIGGGIDQSGGTISISGGTVTAKGGTFGAGIGGGYKQHGGTIAINGGTVTATGGTYGAGIGGGNMAVAGGTITINGGTVTAKSPECGAGIGAGRQSDFTAITITGGTVMATGGGFGAGSIGKSEIASSGTIKITGGSIKSASGAIAPTPTNGNSVPVYLNTLTVGNPAVGDNTSISAGSINNVPCTTGTGTATDYGIKDVKTDAQGKVYFYLPASGGSNQLVALTAPSTEYRKSYTRNADNTNAEILAPPYGISLDQTTTHTFPAATYGYSAQEAKTITVNNVGYEPTGALTVALSGNNSTLFTLSSTTINSIAASSSASFTVVPQTGLGAGTHTETVTVSGTNVTSQSFNVSFTVNKANQTPPSAPTLASKTNNSVTLNTISGAEYSRNGSTWQDDTQFTGLAANTSYTFYARLKETANYNASPASAGLAVKTLYPGNETTVDINTGKSTSGFTSGPGWSFDDIAGVLNIANGANVTVTGSGSSTTNRIVASGATATITLNGVNIDVSGMDYACAFDMTGATVNLTLTGNNILKGGFGRAGLQVPSGAALTIAAASMGSLTATGGYNAAGIGGDYSGAGGTVTINGGTVTATGGYSAAGIGGDYSGSGGTVTINDGTVTATGGDYAAGIGGGVDGSGGTVTINGGTVTATGGDAAAGIGGGRSGSGGNIIISGGTVTATGNNGGAGIGDGGDLYSSGGGAGGNITITGGTVIANGSGSGAAIGGGNGQANSGTVAITGGSVKVNNTNGPQPKNGTAGSSTPVYLNTLTVGSPNVGNSVNITAGNIGSNACTSNSGTATNYGIKDVKTDAQGKVYFWLTESTGNEVVELEANSAYYGKNYTRNTINNNHTLTTPRYDVSLSQSSPHTFADEIYGYATPPEAVTVTVSNAGYMPLSSLSASLGGTNDGDFTLTTTTLNTDNKFSVQPKTGLAFGTHEATVTVSGTGFTGKTFNVSFTVNQANQAAFSIDDPGAKTYGDAAFNLTPSGGSGNGAVTWSSSNTNVATVNASTGQVSIVGAGQTLITAAKAGGTNYNDTTATRTITVNPKALTIDNLVVNNKVYDGGTTATIQGTPTLDGVVLGDDDAAISLVNGTPIFADKNVDNGIAISFNPAFSLTGTKAANYTLTQPTSVTANITKAPVTVTGLSADNKVYDGTATATVNGTALLSPNYDGADLTFDNTNGVATFDNANVGENKTVTFSGFALGGSAAGNYDLTQPASVTANITKAQVTITGLSASNKVYDGNTTATVNGTAALSLNHDGGNLTVNATGGAANFDNANVGENKTVTFSGFALGGSAAGNYDLTQPASVTANITKAPVTVTGLSADNKVYDGTATATVTGTAVLSLNHDGGNLTVNATGGAANFDNANVGENKTVTFSGFALGGSAAGNYDLTGQPASVTADITKAQVTITGLSASNKVYDGNTTATVNGTAALSLNHDGGNLTVNATGGAANFDNANVGENKTVTFSGFALGGSAAGNYDLTGQPASVTANITKAPVTVTGLSADNKVYDGTTAATVTGTAALSPNYDGGNLTFDNTNGVATFDNANVGVGKTVTFSGFALDGSAAGNYDLTQPASVTANITPAPLTVTTLTVHNKTYDGTTDAQIDVATLAPVISPDAVTLVNGTPTFSSKDVATGIAVSFTDFSLAGEQAGNYSLTQPSGVTADITKKALTATAGDTSRIYLQPNPAFTIRYDGFVPAEDESELDTPPVATTAATQSSAAGNYVIAVSNGTDNNYAIIPVNGTLTVTKAAASDAGLTFDLTKLPVEVIVPDGVTGLGEITVRYNGRTTVPTEPGTYEVTVDIAAGASYAGVTGIVAGTYTIPDPADPEPVLREVILPSIPGVTTDPPAGRYYLSSGQDFVFTLTPAATQTLLTPVIKTGRTNDAGDGVEITPNGDGTYTVRIRGVRQPLTVAIDFTTAGSTIGGNRVWSHGSTLYITAATDGEARIYSVSGGLAKAIPVAAGATVNAPLPAGFYVVVLGGKPYKVFVE